MLPAWALLGGEQGSSHSDTYRRAGCLRLAGTAHCKHLWALEWVIGERQQALAGIRSTGTAGCRYTQMHSETSVLAGAPSLPQRIAR